MRIRILESAHRDLTDGYRFYDKQEQGLGAYFLDSLSSDIDSLQVYAGIHSLHYGRYYRMLARRFPFAVYYRIEDQVAVVYAILDCRRAPAWMRERLA